MREKKREKIKEYLKDIGLAKIADTEQSVLEAPISDEELRKALKKHQ